MHPALIPERHPQCGKVMEALVACREQHSYHKFFGACNDITWELSNCLKEEKRVARAPRQERYHERWAAKRVDDEKRMAELQAQWQADKPAGEDAASQ